jgi:hypothetical protein
VYTHYALRHGRGDGLGRLRHWELRGSSDGREWEVLKKHNDDDSLPDEGFGIAHWPLDTTKALSHFRVHQTGPNSSDYNRLCCAGIELFGQLDRNWVLRRMFSEPRIAARWYQGGGRSERRQCGRSKQQ